jgi:hypothetical protein
MTDTSNIPDTFGGGAHKRISASLMPAPVRAVPTFAPERDNGVIADSDKVIEQLKSDLNRQIPQRTSEQPKGPLTTPLKEIAMRIKKLVHDDGEQFGNELEAKMKHDGNKAISVAKALQLWADDTLKSDNV